MKLNKNPFSQFGMEPIMFTDNQQEHFEKLRGKIFTIVTYLPKHYVLNLLKLPSTNCLRYILIEHNRYEDLFDKENNYLKKDHIHIVFESWSRRRASRLCKIFNTTEVMRLTEYNQLAGMVKYLTHETEDCKAKGRLIYDANLLVSNDIEYFRKLHYESYKLDNSLDIIDHINMGLPYRELVALYGRDFVFHFKAYEELALRIWKESQQGLILINDDSGAVIEE